jgi:hypothetical protein
MPLLNSLAVEAKLIQVTSTATKDAHKSFLSWLGGFFLHFSLRVEGWLWIGWVVSFGGFDCFLLFVVVGGRNKFTATKLAHKNFLFWLGGFFLHFSLGVEGRLWIGWVVSFGGFDCFLLFVVVGGRNKLESTILTLVLTPLKPNTQFVCGLGCTLLNSTQIILTYFLTHHHSLKIRSQLGNLLL